MRNLLILLLLVLVSCNSEDEKINLNVTNIQLSDVGYIHYDFNFDAVSGENGVQKCTLRTNNIKKNDSIKYIDGFIKGDKINIDIVSSPYDFDCNEDSCFTIHDVYFNLNGLEAKRYSINIRVNFVLLESFNYQFKTFPK